MGADTRDSKQCGLGSAALHLVLAFKEVVGFEEVLLVEAEGSEVDSAAIEAVALVIEEVSVAIEEAVVGLAIEEASVAEAVSDIRAVVLLEVGVGIRMVLLPLMRPAVQAAAVAGLALNQMGHPHLITLIVAAMVTVIAMDTVEAIPVEAQGTTAATHEEEASPGAIANQSSLETEAMVETETVTPETKIVIVIGMLVVPTAADETRTTGRENDTMKVMGMMTREANEGIRSPSPLPCTATTGLSSSKNTHKGLLVGTCSLRISRLHLTSTASCFVL